MTYPQNGMFVLVGGEAKDTQGCRYEDREFQHTSVPFIGTAYNSLRKAGVSRDRIIVIAQVHDYLDCTLGSWLNTAPQSMKRYIQEEKYRTTAQCARLIEEGGADYDHEDVNPTTVLNVLMGKPIVTLSSQPGSQQQKQQKVIPPSHRGPIFLAIYSHGDSHRTKVGTSGPHESQNAEWFAHMPYPSPQNDNYLDFIATDFATKDKSGQSLASCLLYSTQLRLCFHHLFQQQPSRPIVGLLNYCRSGGGLEFMRKQSAIDHFGLKNWPLYLMSSSDATTDSLVGGFWDAWFGSFCRTFHPSMPPELQHSLVASTSACTATVTIFSTKTTSTTTSSSFSSSTTTSISTTNSLSSSMDQFNPRFHHSPHESSLSHIYQDACRRYFIENVYALMNEIKERSFSYEVWSLEFNWPGQRSGNIDPWHLDLKSHLVPNSARNHKLNQTTTVNSLNNDDDDDEDAATNALLLHSHEPTYEILQELQDYYHQGIAFRKIKKSNALKQNIDLSKGVAELNNNEIVIWTGRNHVTDYGIDRWETIDNSKPYPCFLTAWKGDNQGQQVKIIDIVKQSLKCIAQPSFVHGENSNIDQISVLNFLGIS